MYMYQLLHCFCDFFLTSNFSYSYSVYCYSTSKVIPLLSLMLLLFGAFCYSPFGFVVPQFLYIFHLPIVTLCIYFPPLLCLLSISVYCSSISVFIVTLCLHLQHFYARCYPSFENDFTSLLYMLIPLMFQWLLLTPLL